MKLLTMARWSDLALTAKEPLNPQPNYADGQPTQRNLDDAVPKCRRFPWFLPSRWIEYRRIAARRTMIISQGVRVEGLSGAQSLLEDINHFDHPGAVARAVLSWHTPAKPNRHNSPMSDQADEPSVGNRAYCPKNGVHFTFFVAAA